MYLCVKTNLCKTQAGQLFLWASGVYICVYVCIHKYDPSLTSEVTININVKEFYLMDLKVNVYKSNISLKVAQNVKGSHNLGLIFNGRKQAKIDGLINTDMALQSLFSVIF